MGPTEKDFADKTWLRNVPDVFQLLEPEVAGYIVWATLAACLIADKFGLIP